MERHEGGCKAWYKTNDHIPTRWPCPSTNRSCTLTLIGWTWANLLKSLIILLETTKLLLAQSAVSFQCAHPFLLSPFPLPTLMNPLCGEIVIQVDYTVNWVMEDWMLWKWISTAAVCLPFVWFIYYNRDYSVPKNNETFGEHLSVVMLCRWHDGETLKILISCLPDCNKKEEGPNDNIKWIIWIIGIILNMRSVDYSMQLSGSLRSFWKIWAWLGVFWRGSQGPPRTFGCASSVDEELRRVVRDVWNHLGQHEWKRVEWKLGFSRPIRVVDSQKRLLMTSPYRCGP